MEKVSDNLIYNPMKAGLSSVDKDEISKKIVEASKHTKYFAKQTKKSKELEKGVEDLQKKLKNATKSQLDLAKLKVDAYITALTKKRKLNTTIFHADLDSFFASVEELDDPSLKGIPFAVGGSNEQGICSTSSYEARKFGVRSGMAVFIALKLCPNLKIVPSHRERYIEMSEQVQSLFTNYDSKFTSFGLDEAAMNVTQKIEETGKTAIELAQELQKAVYEKTKLTISIGIALTYQLAKIASDINKPNGIYEIPNDPDEVDKFIWNLPIRKVPGIGGVTEKKLNGINVLKMSDVYEHRAEIWFLFREAFCSFLFSSLVGVTYEPKVEDAKSISKEETFKPTSDLVFLLERVENMCEKLALKIQRGRINCKTVTVKFKTSTFQEITRALTLDQYTSSISSIRDAAVKILMDEHNQKHHSLRLIGVRVSNLVYPGQKIQKSLTDWVIKGQTVYTQNQKTSAVVQVNEIDTSLPEETNLIEIEKTTIESDNLPDQSKNIIKGIEKYFTQSFLEEQKMKEKQCSKWQSSSLKKKEIKKDNKITLSTYFDKNDEK
ncbi:DNA polymerase kappa [Tritrichomonas foetus]|uniref:DNA polymerase kappa n=1 Tax=Tritrichomonas foetus TaxID=1144522 RepID=A0A1J4J3E9_9EUKA|nr:DNA polymerase kappa [Tritrichomonas foetus]|eukprot:OHS93265.1 DNA polymerase kappa [Tritrichomonas foetus]